MIIKCTRDELRKLVVGCSDGDCTMCALNDFCDTEKHPELQAGEYIASIAVVTDAYAACRACVPAAEEAANG